jgi:hypothetical protein
VLQQFVPSYKNATGNLPEFKEEIQMTVFEMEVFYTLFPHIGLYVQEMSIFFVLPGSSLLFFRLA